MAPLVIDRALALRLEGAEAANAEAAIHRAATRSPAGGAMSLRTCGGVAGFAGPGSFLSQLLHAALDGPVPFEEWNRMERFFRERETACVVSLSPYADPSVFEWLAKRHYRISHFENTLVRRVDEVLPLVQTEVSTPADTLAWARRMIEGFTGQCPPSGDDSLTGLVIALATAEPSTALEIRFDGQTSACGILGILGSTALFHCDSTIERFRGRGLQPALIQDRLRRAHAAGCELAMACTLPGSVSQRNYERAGFQVAYTKTMLVKDWS